MSLAGRVGTGNIAIATAIAFWWTWSHALDVDGRFLGASTAFIEATLAQIIKKTFRTVSWRPSIL
jgi:AGCS family alanine or glycine:cation symporter